MLPQEAQQEKEKNPVGALPDIPGYLTLKGDFHLHTVFSDGHVWPSFRVREAERDGLDVISLTEHIDYEGFPEELGYARENAYEIAVKAAANTHVLVIPGIEISPRVPPYHHNALFVRDLDDFSYDYMKDTQQTFVMKDTIKREELMAPFLQVQEQDGFVMYNHPSYNWWDRKEKILFTDFHEELLEKGILGGVEVVNGNRYNIIAHRMAEKYGLTMFGNSDAHYDIAGSYKETARPITLVFAKEKTPEGVKEALLNRRTMVYYDGHLIGRKKEAEAFFRASLKIETEKQQGKNAPRLKVSFTNLTDIPYELSLSSEYNIDYLPLGRLKIGARETASLLLNPVWEYPEELVLKARVENLLVSPEEALETELKVTLNEQK